MIIVNNSRNKYRYEITTQPKNNNLDYLIDSIFRNINRLFVISFINSDDDPARNAFNAYYIPLVEIIYLIINTFLIKS